MDEYQVVRYYESGGVEVIRHRITLEEAQEWCADPETSSSTCTSREAWAWTKQYGPWFDGYRKLSV